MAVGDVTVELVNMSGQLIDDAMTTQRAAGGSSGAYMVAPYSEGQQMIVASISGI